ncbi:hypothetical protein QBC34DRAFT_414437 [Podospora aff. communis PSN243]|uniref:Integral membrane protein n=1 Tax=Podospora aff. communis PSN243 TaxID=3040156 RepID=A0AAV9G9M0_9PEZI|nr:hypothetical protein QBC34DRAFT_414437 [Podospora aff. communis PSN243]
MTSPPPKNLPPPSGALTFLNPTLRYHPVAPDSKPPTEAVSGQPPGKPSPSPPPSGEEHPPIYHVWRSRDNRKGRHAILLPKTAAAAKHQYPPLTNTLASTGRGILKMLTSFPVWDVSYDVAIVFTLGCIVWVINGFFVWYPLAAPWSEFPGEESVGGGWTAFVGATIFEFGSVLLMLEALNENQTDCFGWALTSALTTLESHTPLLRPTPTCTHHHANKHTWISPSPSPSNKPKATHKVWTWSLPLSSFKHHLHSTSFLASLFQLFGATVFWISGFTALPFISSRLSTSVSNGIYWLPQVVGGTGFILSSIFFMLEVQTRWYRPEPGLLGWHVGFWNLVGAVGFTLCGALGFAEGEGKGVEYALALSTFVGSWAFLVSDLFCLSWVEECRVCCERTVVNGADCW